MEPPCSVLQYKDPWFRFTDLQTDSQLCYLVIMELEANYIGSLNFSFSV